MQGLRPATKEVMEGILGSGGSVLLCPGGVQVRAGGVRGVTLLGKDINLYRLRAKNWQGHVFMWGSVEP